MNCFRGLFKDKKKKTRRRASSHQVAHHYHDASVSDDKAKEEHTHQCAQLHTEQTSSHDREAPSVSEPNEALRQQTTSESEQVSEIDACQAPAQEQRPPLRKCLQPAYRYTCGKFSETISREEAMLAQQYNFSSPSDRTHAEATASSTRRNVGDSKNGEFASIFMQFMHGAVDQ